MALRDVGRRCRPRVFTSGAAISPRSIATLSPAKSVHWATRFKTLAMFGVVTRDSRSQDALRTSSTDTVNAVRSGTRPFRNSLVSVDVRRQTMKLRYLSGKRGLTSFRRYLPSESATFSKDDGLRMRDKRFARC